MGQQPTKGLHVGSRTSLHDVEPCPATSIESASSMQTPNTAALSASPPASSSKIPASAPQPQAAPPAAVKKRPFFNFRGNKTRIKNQPDPSSPGSSPSTCSPTDQSPVTAAGFIDTSARPSSTSSSLTGTTSSSPSSSVPTSSSSLCASSGPDALTSTSSSSSPVAPLIPPPCTGPPSSSATRGASATLHSGPPSSSPSCPSGGVESSRHEADRLDDDDDDDAVTSGVSEDEDRHDDEDETAVPSAVEESAAPAAAPAVDDAASMAEELARVKAELAAANKKIADKDAALQIATSRCLKHERKAAKFKAEAKANEFKLKAAKAALKTMLLRAIAQKRLAVEAKAEVKQLRDAAAENEAKLAKANKNADWRGRAIKGLNAQLEEAHKQAQVDEAGLERRRLQILSLKGELAAEKEAHMAIKGELAAEKEARLDSDIYAKSFSDALAVSSEELEEAHEWVNTLQVALKKEKSANRSLNKAVRGLMSKLDKAEADKKLLETHLVEAQVAWQQQEAERRSAQQADKALRDVQLALLLAEERAKKAEERAEMAEMRAAYFEAELDKADEAVEILLDASEAEVKGAGNFGRVRVLRDRHDDMRVAVKEMRLAGVSEGRRLVAQNEALANATVAAADIAGCVKAMVTFMTPRRAFVFMPPVENTLDKFLPTIHDFYEQGNSNVANLLVESVLRQLIVICRNLHREGILHSDYKADNIAARLVNREDGTLDIEIEVLDFGCAQLNYTGQMAAAGGALNYMSPEMLCRRATAVDPERLEIEARVGHDLFMIGTCLLDLFPASFFQGRLDQHVAVKVAYARDQLEEPVSRQVMTDHIFSDMDEMLQLVFEQGRLSGTTQALLECLLHRDIHVRERVLEMELDKLYWTASGSGGEAEQSD